MKRHEYQNGRLFQVDKKFSQLTRNQKEWISGLLREKYIEAMTLNHGKKPTSSTLDKILLEVYEAIQERDIWIPIVEVERYFKGKLNRFASYYNKQNKISS